MRAYVAIRRRCNRAEELVYFCGLINSGLKRMRFDEGLSENRRNSALENIDTNERSRSQISYQPNLLRYLSLAIWRKLAFVSLAGASLQIPEIEHRVCS